MIRRLFHTASTLLTGIVRELNANDVLRQAGATAFFTSFALPPIVMIIVRTLGLFLDKRTIGARIMAQLRTILGPDSTEAIIKAIRSFRELQHNSWVTAGLSIFLLFVATTLFKVIKNSINQIWKIRKKQNAGILYGLQARGLSVAVILLGGVLFLGVQLIDSGVQLLTRFFPDDYPAAALFLGKSFSQLIVLFLSAIWFFVLFTILPDGRPHWKVAATGAVITSVLFNIGKWVIQLLLQPGNVRNFYGASGALVLVLLFVFYSSIILYFGAAFIKIWGEHCGLPMRVKANAFRYRLEEISVQ